MAYKGFLVLERAKWYTTAFIIGTKAYVAAGVTRTYPNPYTAELWRFTP
jgi:hypothetical protein